jgi:hypothetical protein
MKLKSLALVGLCLGGCGGCGGASPKADFDNICNVVVRSGARANPDRMGRGMQIASWLARTVQSKEGKGFLSSLNGMDGKTRDAQLKVLAAQYGIARCPLAEEGFGI